MTARIPGLPIVWLFASSLALGPLGCGGNAGPASPTSALSVTMETGHAGAAAGGVMRTVAFPPRNEPFAFRQELEAKYRDGLRRQPQSTFVDLEGDIVWITEYTRYRVNGCDHAEAEQRVMMQIDGYGVQPVCGGEQTGATVRFPPRNEPFAFRQALEAKYRDGLGRSAESTYVDLEGDIVWITEYTRYRVNNCNHAEATTRVFSQIDGGGVAPVCASGGASGWIADLQAARDIIDWNMAAGGGSSYRRQDRICRWELPVRVYVQAGPDRDRVIAALDYWRAQAGVDYRLVPTDGLPRLLVRFGMDGLPPWGGGRALVDGTNPDNSVKSALAVYQPGGGTYCSGGSTTSSCLMLYRHELGHTLGIYVNTPVGLMGGATELSDRERRMMAALYALPHGARVEADGTWRVLPQ